MNRAEHSGFSLVAATRAAGRRLLLGIWSASMLASAAAASLGPGDTAEAALKSAAAALYPTAAAAGPLELSHVRNLDLYSSGFVYDTYEVRRSGGATLGRMTRMRIFSEPGSTIDVAVSHERGRVTTVAPVFPVVLGGKPFPELQRIVAGLQRRRIEDYASGLATIVAALPLAVEAATARQDDDAKPAPARPGEQPAVVVSQPELALGAPMPPFEVEDVQGKKVRSAGLSGRWVVLVFGEIENSISRDCLRLLSRQLARRPGAGLLVVLREDAATVKRRMPDAQLTSALAAGPISDPDGALSRLFLAPFLPYLFVFDPAGKLVYKDFWRGGEALARHLDAIGGLK